MRLLRRFFIAWVVALVRVDADTEPVAVDVVDPVQRWRLVSLAAIPS